MQRVAAVHIAETEVRGAKGLGAILIKGFAHRGIADDRRIVDRRHVEGHGAHIGGRGVAVINRPGEGRVAGAVGIRRRMEGQFADIGRADHRAVAEQGVADAAHAVTVGIDKQLTGGRRGDDSNGLQRVAAVHIAETEVRGAKGLGGILIKGFAYRGIADDRRIIDRRDAQHRLIAAATVERTVVKGPAQGDAGRRIVGTVGIGQGLQHGVYHCRGGVAIERQCQGAARMGGDAAHRRAVVGEVLPLRQRPQQAAVAEAIVAAGSAVAGNGNRRAVIVAQPAVKGIQFGVGNGDIAVHHHRAAIFGIGRPAVQAAEDRCGIGR